MLLRTRILVGCEERSLAPARSGQTFFVGFRRGPSSRCSSGHASSSDAKRGPSLPLVARDRHASSHVWLTITPPPPMFFVSVDSRGFRFVVSCLESTLVGWLVSVAFKWVRAGTIWRGFSQEARCGSEFACAVRSWLLLKDRGRAADPLPLQVDVYFHSVGDLDEGYALVHAVVFTVEGHRSSDAA